MSKSIWRERTATQFSCEKRSRRGAGAAWWSPTTRWPAASRHGSAGRRRQCRRRRRRHPVRPHRGRADDGGSDRRHRVPYPPGRRESHHHRRHERRAARRPPGHVPSDPRRRAGNLRYRGSGKPRRSEIGGRAGVAARLVLRLAPPWNHAAGRRDAAGDPPCRTRLCRHALSLRLHRERGARPRERRSHRRPSHAGRQPAQPRRAPRPGRLFRGANPDRAAGRGGAARQPTRRPSGRVHGEDGPASSRARTSPATRWSSARQFAAAIAAGKSSVRRRGRLAEHDLADPADALRPRRGRCSANCPGTSFPTCSPARSANAISVPATICTATTASPRGFRRTRATARPAASRPTRS